MKRLYEVEFLDRAVVIRTAQNVIEDNAKDVTVGACTTRQATEGLKRHLDALFAPVTTEKPPAAPVRPRPGYDERGPVKPS